MSPTRKKSREPGGSRTEQLGYAFTVACDVALTAGIFASILYLLLALASLLTMKPAFGQLAP
jgi:hypothetical protein